MAQPKEGDKKRADIPGTLRWGKEYTYYAQSPDGIAPPGWYTDPDVDELDYGGNGPQPVPGSTPPESEAPAAPGAGLRTFQDPNTGQWFQEVPGDPEKTIVVDGKSQVTPAGPAKYVPVPGVPEPTAETSEQPIISEDGRFFKSSPTDQWQRIPPQAAEKPPTVDEMLAAALNDYFTKGDQKALDTAIALDDFSKRPSQMQKLEAAIRYAQSPADYLTIVGMMRGEMPIGPSGSTWRLGPQNQVFDAFGFPASPNVAAKAQETIASGGQAGAGGTPVGAAPAVGAPAPGLE